MGDRPNLTADELLTTTRAVRKRLDYERPVDPQLVRECVELASQAPTGSNRQSWRFVAVVDSERRAAIASRYREGFADYQRSPKFQSMLHGSGDARADAQRRVGESAVYLAENLHLAPVLLIPCQFGAPGPSTMEQAGFWGSLFPAVWSFMMAARSRGLGTVLTTIHLRFEDEIAELLQLPQNVTQGGLLPVAHYTGGSFRPAQRRPVEDFLAWDTWTGR